MIKANPLYREIIEGIRWNFSTSNHTQIDGKRLPKKYRAYLLIICSGENGITENEILLLCRLSSGRNYCSELERLLSIELKRKNMANPDGIGSHYRYFIQSRKDAEKVLKLILNYDKNILTENQILKILNRYPIIN